MPAPERKSWAQQLQAEHKISIVLSCAISGISRTAYYYEPKRVDDDEIIDLFEQLLERYPRWGFPKYFKRMRKLGKPWNHKRVYRVYTQLKLNLRRKNKRRLPARNPEPLTVPAQYGDCWSMDFMSDRLHNSVRYRTFNVIDDFNREILGIDIGVGMPAKRVTRYLDRLAAWYGYPKKIRVDNGPEFTSSEFTDWAGQHQIQIDYIQPGRPYQNAFIERFNKSYREEILDLYLFKNLQQVQQQTEDWIHIYNNERPHESLNDMTPIEYLTAA